MSPDQRCTNLNCVRGSNSTMAIPSLPRTSNLASCATNGLNILREKVREVEIVDPYRVRFHLHAALARFHDLLRHPGHGGGLDRAEEVYRAGGR